MHIEQLVTSRFQEAGLLLDRGALKLLADHVGRCEDDLQQLLDLTEKGTHLRPFQEPRPCIASFTRQQPAGHSHLGFLEIWVLPSAGSDSKITATRAKALIDSLQNSGDTALIQVVNASHCPRIKFDHLRRAFVSASDAPSCFATAQVSTIPPCIYVSSVLV